MSRWKNSAALAVAAFAAFGVSACAAKGTTSSEPEQPNVLALLASDAKGSVQKTMDTTAKATSVSLTMTGTADGEPVKGHGVVALGGPLKAELAIDETREGPLGRDPRGGEPTTVRMLGTVFYVQLPEKDRAEMGGKQWMKMDLAAAGADADAMSRQFADIDPAQQLKAQLAGGEITVVGQDTVNGVPTVHYTGSVPVSAYLAQLDAKLRASAEKEMTKMGAKEIKTDLWVDEQYQLRRSHVVMGTQSDLTVDYTDYGKPVTVEAPPATETADFADLLKGIPTGK